MTGSISGDGVSSNVCICVLFVMGASSVICATTIFSGGSGGGSVLDHQPAHPPLRQRRIRVNAERRRRLAHTLLVAPDATPLIARFGRHHLVPLHLST